MRDRIQFSMHLGQLRLGNVEERLGRRGWQPFFLSSSFFLHLVCNSSDSSGCGLRRRQRREL
jgi:hypothetical protein